MVSTTQCKENIDHLCCQKKHNKFNKLNKIIHTISIAQHKQPKHQDHEYRNPKHKYQLIQSPHDENFIKILHTNILITGTNYEGFIDEFTVDWKGISRDLMKSYKIMKISKYFE